MHSKPATVWRALDSAVSQLAQAASSLMTTLTFVNLFDTQSFGVWAACWAIWMLLMSMNRAVFGEQLIAQSHNPEMRHGYLDFCFFWVTAGITVALIVALAAGGATLLPGILCIAFFVASDMVRYSEMARQDELPVRRLSLLPIEGLRLVTVAAALAMALAGWAPLWPTTLALISSLIWVGVGMRSSGIPKLERARFFLRRREKFERLMTIQFLTGTGLAQVIPFLALHAFGAAQFGAIRLTQSVLSPMTLLASAFQPSLIRLYASRRTAQNLPKVVLSTVLLSIFVGACMTFIAIWIVNVAGELLIPSSQAEAVNQILAPIAVLLSMVVVGQPGGALIRVFRLGSASLWGQNVGISVTVVLGVLATQQDLATFVWALAAGSATTVLSTYILLVAQLVRSQRSRVPDGGEV